jgi:AraC-like DNA-binding protein
VLAASGSDYRELAPRAELSDVLACTWHQHVTGDRAQRVVPDGCVDLIWLAGRRLIVAGPATQVSMAALPAGSATVGVRFAPGAGAGLLGLPLSELRDRDVGVCELWGMEVADRLEAALAGSSSAAEQRELLEAALLARRARAAPVDRLVLAAAAAVGGPRVSGASGSAGASPVRGAPPRVRDLGDALGVSERQLLRRFRAAVGYGPKTFARVMRFQRFVTAAWADPAVALGDGAGAAGSGGAGSGSGGGLGRLALDAGYADQAHLSRECRSLAGATPRQLMTGR